MKSVNFNSNGHCWPIWYNLVFSFGRKVLKKRLRRLEVSDGRSWLLHTGFYAGSVFSPICCRISDFGRIILYEIPRILAYISIHNTMNYSTFSLVFGDLKESNNSVQDNTSERQDKTSINCSIVSKTPPLSLQFVHSQNWSILVYY